MSPSLRYYWFLQQKILFSGWIWYLSQTVQKQSPRGVYEKGVLRNFAKFTRKDLCQRLFNKVAGLRPATLLKKRLCTGAFLWILRDFWEHLFHGISLVAASSSPTGFRCGLLWKYKLNVGSSHWSCSVKKGETFFFFLTFFFLFFI